MFDMQKIGKKIVALRREKNMTQTELADRLNVSFQAVSNWERGQSMPDISKLPELAEIFEISIDELLGVKSKFVKSVADGRMEEYLDSEEVSAAEISEAVPILTPDQVETVIEKTDPAEFEDIGAFLPYMSEDDVAEIAMEMAKMGNDVEEFLPYMDEDDIGELAIEAVKHGHSGRVFLSYMCEDDVAKLAENALAVGENVESYLNYMNEDDVAKLAAQALSLDKEVKAYLIYMCEDDIGKLAMKAVEKGKPVEEFLPYMDEDDVGKVLKAYLKKRNP